MTELASILGRVRAREAGFALAALTIWVGSRVFLANVPEGVDPRTIERAVTVDLTVTLSALWYLLVVRGRGWPALTTAPFFLASIVVAWLVLPDGRRGALEAIEWLAIPVELLVLGAIVIRARRASRAFRGAEAPDLRDRIRIAAAEVAPARVAEILAYEVAMLWHALARRLPPVEPRAGEVVLTSHLDEPRLLEEALAADRR